LLDFCISSNLQILNGKLFGDSVGRYTSYHYNSNNVVGYWLVSEQVLQKKIYFNVA
jgi:hypothetical protein